MSHHPRNLLPVAPETARRVTVTEQDLLDQLVVSGWDQPDATDPASLLRLLAHRWMTEHVFGGELPNDRITLAVFSAYVSVVLGHETDRLIMHLWFIEHGGWTFVADGIDRDQFPLYYVSDPNDPDAVPQVSWPIWVVHEDFAPGLVT